MLARLAPLTLGLAAALSLFAPSTARAGGCTSCTTSAECVAMFGAPAFCIAWDDPAGGCTGVPVACCPGQGCSALSGRPSCEAEGRCHVVDQDAGTSSGTDAGSGGRDAGTSSGTDAGTGSGMDAGTTPSPRGGCACGVAGHANGAGALVALGLVLAVLARRRTR